ncbi:MAG: hypothetical protein ABIL25_03405 [candidate division WOR-3 bacterium]
MFASDIPLERREELLDRIARKIVDLRLTPVAIVMLESSKPVSFVGSQVMVFLQPIITAVFPFRQYDEIAALLEERSNIELLIRKIELLEDARPHGKGKDNKNPGN